MVPQLVPAVVPQPVPQPVPKTVPQVVPAAVPQLVQANVMRVATLLSLCAKKAYATNAAHSTNLHG